MNALNLRSVSALSMILALTAACGLQDDDKGGGSEPTPPACEPDCNDGSGDAADVDVTGNAGDDTNSPDTVVTVNVNNNATAAGDDANSGDTNVDGSNNNVVGSPSNGSGGATSSGGTNTGTGGTSSCTSSCTDPEPEFLHDPIVSWKACDSVACSCTLGFHGDHVPADADNVTAYFHDNGNPGVAMNGDMTTDDWNDDGYATLVFMAKDVNPGIYRLTYKWGDQWAQYGSTVEKVASYSDEGQSWLYSASLEDGDDSNIPYFDGLAELKVWTNSAGQKACEWLPVGNADEWY